MYTNGSMHARTESRFTVHWISLRFTYTLMFLSVECDYLLRAEVEEFSHCNRRISPSFCSSYVNSQNNSCIP